MSRLFSKISLVIVLLLAASCSLATGHDEVENYMLSKIYLGFGFGLRLIEPETFTTPVPGTNFVVDDKARLSEQLAVGYDLTKYVGFEGQFTFFPSSVYLLTPQSDSIIRKVYAFSALIKFMIPFWRFRFDFGGGGSVVYTLAPNFEIFVPTGSIYAPTDGTNYIIGNWGHKDFFRPEYFLSLGFYTSKRILVSVVYSKIFGKGSFSARPELFVDRNAEFFVEKNYLPDLKMIMVMITMKI